MKAQNHLTKGCLGFHVDNRSRSTGFTRRLSSAHVEELSAPPAVQPIGANRRRLAIACATVLVASLAVAAGVNISRPSPNAVAFQRFWDPVLRDPAPLLVAVAHPIVYHASGRALRLSEERLPAPETP